MSWKWWSAVAVVIGGLAILLQIPGQDQVALDDPEMGHSEMPASMADVQGPFTAVALDVTGMT